MTSPLFIDVREACGPHRTGKGQWTAGFVDELLRRHLPVTLVTNADVPREWEKDSVHVQKIPGRGLLWHWNVLKKLRAMKHTVTYVSPTSYIVPAFCPKNVSCIPVVHDLIAFRGDPHDTKATVIERILLPKVLRRCSRILTVSEATKRDLLDRFPSLPASRVTAIFAGPLHPHPQLNVADEKTIVCIGTLCPRKNQLRLIRAFALLPADIREQYQLILAGNRGWDDRDIVREANTAENVRWLGYINHATYEKLMTHCTVFALPSLYEGFGMQILDALQRGIPVLTSSRGSLREVAEGASLIVDPDDVQSIGDGLRRMLTDIDLRHQLREKGMQRAAVYSWKKTVDLFLEVL